MGTRSRRLKWAEAGDRGGGGRERSELDGDPVCVVGEQARTDAAGAVLCGAPHPRRTPRPRGRDRAQVPRPHRATG